MSLKHLLFQQGEAEFILPEAPGASFQEPIRFFMTPALVASMDEDCIQQAINTAAAPGVVKLSLGPDCHRGFGCPVGSVVVTEDMVYPGPVGPDICCSMSYLQTNLSSEVVRERPIRRQLIDAIVARIPSGASNRFAPKGRGQLSRELRRRIIIEGPSAGVLQDLGVPLAWAARCELAASNDAQRAALADRWLEHERTDFKQDYLLSKVNQIGSYGAGNHFGEAQITQIVDQAVGAAFGLRDGCVGFLSHCGSRGFGYRLAEKHFKGLAAHFAKWHIPLPGGDKELVYAPVESPEGQAYLLDMALGANMATVNHLLLNQLVSEAFAEVFGAAFQADFVYHISHNIGRHEMWKDMGGSVWKRGYVWRKGATRSMPGNHPSLARTCYEGIGHPILLPGDPVSGSRIMVGRPGAAKSAFSINHGAGRAMGRKEAKRQLTRAVVNETMERGDVLFNSRDYPVDEAPQAYKDFNEVCGAVEKADLASTVANLRAIFVIKDNDSDPEGAA